MGIRFKVFFALVFAVVSVRGDVKNMLIVYGQGLSLGETGCPAISTTQPYSNQMLNDAGTVFLPLTEIGTCVYPLGGLWDSSAAYQARALVAFNGSPYSALAPNISVAPDADAGTWQPAPLTESPASSLANNVTLLDPTHSFAMIVSGFGLQAATIADLQRGSVSYSNILNGVANASALLSPGDTLVVVGVFFFEGTADFIYGSTTYKADNLVLRASLDADIKSITGQTQDIRFFYPQMSSMMSAVFGTNIQICPDQSWGCIDDPAGAAAPGVAISQWQLQRDYPQWFYLTGPGYQYTTDGGTHPDYVGYNTLGATAARVLKSVLVDGNTSAVGAVFPVDISRTDAVITIQTATPNGLPLAIDTDTVPNPYYNDAYDLTGKGFQFFSTGGNSDTTAISNVAVSGTTITITLNQVPTGENQRIAYAFEGVGFANTFQFGCGPDDTMCNGYSLIPSRGTVHGNIRTVDDYVDLHGETVYHWMVHFNEPVGFHWTRTDQ